MWNDGLSPVAVAYSRRTPVNEWSHTSFPKAVNIEKENMDRATKFGTALSSLIGGG